MIYKPQSLFVFTLFLTTFLVISCTEKNQHIQEEESSGRELDFTGQVAFLQSESDSIPTIEVAVAKDNQSRSEGLMNVLDLPENSGMLFIFDNDQPRSFWMANTPLPLDIIFINAEMNIVRIHHNTQPYSQKSIQSGEPAQFVVEVNAGYALEHDIREGMKIQIEDVDY